jgi:hypothetical protein
MILLPPAALLAALALNVIYEVARDLLQRHQRIPRALAPAVVVALLAWIGVRNWNTYIEQASFANALTRSARYMLEQPATAKAYVVSSVWTYRIREFEFLVPQRVVADLPPDQVQSQIPRIGTPTLLILTPEQAPVIEALQLFYPKGRLQSGSGNYPGEIPFYVFRLP